LGVTIIDREVTKGDPIENQNLRRLGERIKASAKKKGTFDELLIYRHQGAAGMQEIGKGVQIAANPSDSDCEEAARLLLNEIDEHAEKEGVVQYQIRGFGETGGGQTTEKMRFAYRPGGDEEESSEAGNEMMDVVKAARLSSESMAKSIEAVTALNTVLTDNFGKMTGEVVGMLTIAKEQGTMLVEAEKIRVEAEKWRLDKEFEARDADREAETSKERMRQGVAVVGMAADGFLATMNRKAHEAASKIGLEAKPVKRGDAAKAGLDKIWSTFSSEDKVKARAAVGDDAMDLFESAVAKSDAAERIAVLKRIRVLFDSWPQEHQEKVGKSLQAAIGAERTTALMLFVMGMTAT
jgi:hypothetical protein